MLDASVLLKWVVPEEGQASALAYRPPHEAGTDVVAVPVLAWYEMANGLRRHRELSSDDCAHAFQGLWESGFEVHGVSDETLVESLELARSRGISLYDACYIALAQELRCPFVTADRRLWEKMKRAPDVVLLGGAK